MRIARSRPSARLWPWTASGALVGLLLALLLFAPARWLAGAVHTFSQGRVLLLDPQGTLWHGSARLVLSAGPGSHEASALPDRLQWETRPHWDGLRLQAQVPCCTSAPLQLDLRPGFDGVRLLLAAPPSNWPAELLAGLGTPWNTVRLQGQLTITTPRLELALAADRLRLYGELTIEGRDLSSRLSTLHPLGSYRLTLHGNGMPALRLQTLDGSLRLSGQGQWVGQRLRFAGEASATPGQLDELANVLNIIGRRDGVRSVINLG